MINPMVALAVVLALNAGPLCFAGESDKIPDELVKVWQDLRTAILAGDVAAVGAMASFPLKSLDYGYDKVESVVDLENRFAVIFEPKLLEIIEDEGACIMIQGEPEYEVDCANGYMIFGFEDHDGEYRLSYLGSINE